MAFVKRMRNLHAGGNAERTQVAVEYRGLVPEHHGETDAGFLRCLFVDGRKKYSGSSKPGMLLDVCSEPLREDSKVEILSQGRCLYVLTLFSHPKYTFN